MRILVEDVMTTDVAAVREDTALRTIAEMLMKRQISGMPVVDSDCRVVGVVSEADVMHKQARRGVSDDREESPVAAAGLMTSSPVTIRADESVVTAARRMEFHKIKRLPVVNSERRLCGIISRRDVLAAVASRS